jgi:hypothetical protein
MTNSPAAIELLGRCSPSRRARLVYYDDINSGHQEPYGQIFLAARLNVYEVICPACGEQFTTLAGIERVGRRAQFVSNSTQDSSTQRENS